MNKTDISKIEKVVEKLGWNMQINGKEFTFSQFSPAGQDFNVEITANDLEELSMRLDDYYEAYDVSYEAYLWLDNTGHGTNGAPHDMKDVYDDMVACEEMLKELSEAIEALLK
jgi:hypothetical protein